ncbi:hypothetical protein AAF712_002221 [Marasmius tenuissimus]|uniref:NADP-dependent oxidoreductase domain-containing protein n=1 Tax=Marasmius tenuissimus TaxID=585030 RepID=A0ABR3AA45_9AGAR
MTDDPLDTSLRAACGDIVQAAQALKESHTPLTSEHCGSLVELQSALDGCETYCSSTLLPYPFRRAQRQVDDLLKLRFPTLPSRTSGISVQDVDHLNLSIDQAQAVKLEYYSLGKVKIPRLVNGLWQLSSPAWGSASLEKQNEALSHLVRAGLVAADMADHYGDAELIYGAFRNGLSTDVSQQVVAATKWCVFRPLGKPVTAQLVLGAVMERYRRAGGRLELLQFHWYDYRDKDYLDILLELTNIAHSHPHIVSEIGLCNFDAKHTEEACAFLLERTGKVGIVSNQVQFSLIDGRPAIYMANISAYHAKLNSAKCGGFLSQKWLGSSAPDIYSETTRLTPSQRKYFDMILLWGTWEEFQRLLRTLKEIADKHVVEVSNVAARWVLDRQEVGAVIVGTRLGVSSNIESNVKVFSFALDEEDRANLEKHDLYRRAKAVYGKIGDCGHEYQRA